MPVSPGQLVSYFKKKSVNIAGDPPMRAIRQGVTCVLRTAQGPLSSGSTSQTSPNAHPNAQGGGPVDIPALSQAILMTSSLYQDLGWLVGYLTEPDLSCFQSMDIWPESRAMDLTSLSGH